MLEQPAVRKAITSIIQANLLFTIDFLPYCVIIQQSRPCFNRQLISLQFFKTFAFFGLNTYFTGFSGTNMANLGQYTKKNALSIKNGFEND
jgi:hypothetical protein